jgi:hypothetical protein
MPFFLQYHNVARLGWVPLDEVPFLQTQLAIVTRRPSVKKAVGGTVFVIASLGRPRRYYLWECFRIEGVEPDGDSLCAWGTGWQLVPPVRLSGEAFESFRWQCANFVGFRNIDDLPYSATLDQLARSHRQAHVDEATERFCDELIEALPDSPDVHYFRGFVRSCLGRHAEARADLDEAVQRGTEFLDAALACRAQLDS